MANPPPIIRSSKAFSVEIPEGSNSAKSRRSDIVANDDLDIHRKSSQFHEAGSDALKSPDFHTDDGADAHSVSDTSTDHADNIHHEAQAHTDKDRYAGEDSHTLSENLQGIDHNQAPANLIAVADSEQNAANRQAVDEDAYRDRQARVDSGHALQDRFAAETHAPLKDRALSIEAQGLSSNVQGIEQDALHDHLQSLPLEEQKNNLAPGIDKDALKDNRQGLADEALNHANQGLARSQDPAKNMQGMAQDALHDNQQSIDNEALHDNQQALADEGLHDNQQSIDNEALEDNQQALPDEGLHDNQQSIANEALEDNQQALPDEGLHDNQQSIDNEALHDNKQALPDESLQGRKDTQEKTHVQDHVVALPDTHQVLKSGPSPLTAHAHPGQQPGAAVHAQTPLHPESDPHHAALSKAEKAKRMEEFHGRVEAIRKSVSGINHLLDDLQDKH